MLDISFMIGAVPTIVGVLILCLGFYFIFFNPSKEKFWGCFLIGSLLMSSPLIIGITYNPDSLPSFAVLWFVSAGTWVVFMLVFGVATSHMDDFITADRIFNDESDKAFLLENECASFFAYWDELHSDAVKFKYKIIRYKPVPTFLNKLKGEQHFTKKCIQYSFDNIEDCNKYLDKLIKTPHALK